jgi:hypothetical protein
MTLQNFNLQITNDSKNNKANEQAHELLIHKRQKKLKY